MQHLQYNLIKEQNALRDTIAIHLIANPGWPGPLNFWRIQQSLLHLVGDIMDIIVQIVIQAWNLV